MSSTYWEFGDPVDFGAGYRELEDGESIPEGAESYMTRSWQPVGPGCVGDVYRKGNKETKNSWYHFPIRIKFPEPPAPRALEEEILEHLDAQEAKPSEDSADALRYNSFFQQGAPGAQGWSVLSEVSTDLPKHDPKTNYLADIYPVDGTTHTDANGKQFVRIDVYSVLRAFGVDHPTGHAIKKLLCAGLRGKGDRVQDLTEAKVAIDRAIQEAGI